MIKLKTNNCQLFTEIIDKKIASNIQTTKSGILLWNNKNLFCKSLFLSFLTCCSIQLSAQVDICTNCPLVMGDAMSTASPTTTTLSFDVACSSNCLLSANPLESFVLDIQHEYLGDLEITLKAPDGSSVDLFGPYCNGGDPNSANTPTTAQTVCFITERDDAAGADNGLGDKFIFTFVDAAPTSSGFNDGTSGRFEQTEVNDYIYNDLFVVGNEEMLDTRVSEFLPFSGNLSDLTGSINGTWQIVIMDRYSSNSGDVLNVSLGLNDESGVSALPVELISFSASTAKEVIALNWSTASEQNNSGFEIQRSTDGVNFYKIGWMDGEGNSDREVVYQYTDQEVKSNTKYYYRLRQIDFDGAEDFSPIEAVRTTGKENVVSIQPNPVATGNDVQININAVNVTDGQVLLFDITGREVLNQSFSTVKGNNMIDLPMQEVTNGNYFVKVILGANTHYQKLIVQ